MFVSDVSTKRLILRTRPSDGNVLPAPCGRGFPRHTAGFCLRLEGTRGAGLSAVQRRLRPSGHTWQQQLAFRGSPWRAAGRKRLVRDPSSRLRRGPAGLVLEGYGLSPQVNMTPNSRFFCVKNLPSDGDTSEAPPQIPAAQTSVSCQDQMEPPVPLATPRPGSARPEQVCWPVPALRPCGLG